MDQGQRIGEFLAYKERLPEQTEITNIPTSQKLQVLFDLLFDIKKWLEYFSLHVQLKK